MSRLAADAVSHWLEFRDTKLSQAIVLGLDRVSEAIAELGIVFNVPVFMVAGTNGKGSVAFFLEAILRSAGYRTGLYQSPVLGGYHERILFNGVPVGDAVLAKGLKQVATSAGSRTLTVFEYDTLVALYCLSQAGIDVAVLEIGMGGRLDAVNAIMPDVSIVTTVGIDHQDWLGDDREAIGFEKAGIFRAGRPAICGDMDPPVRLIEHAREIHADLQIAGQDFRSVRFNDHWDFEYGSQSRWGLPLPAMRGAHQVANAATALAALAALSERLPVDQAAVREGLLVARQPGRFEVCPGKPNWVLDVAHNAQAVQALADTLAGMPCRGRLIAVLAMLADKDVAGVVAALQPQVDLWLPAGLAVPRGLSGLELLARLPEGLAVGGMSQTVEQALESALDMAGPEDTVLAFGSFHTVGQARAWLSEKGL